MYRVETKRRARGLYEQGGVDSVSLVRRSKLFRCWVHGCPHQDCQGRSEICCLHGLPHLRPRRLVKRVLHLSNCDRSTKGTCQTCYKCSSLFRWRTGCAISTLWCPPLKDSQDICTSSTSSGITWTAIRGSLYLTRTKVCLQMINLCITLQHFKKDSLRYRWDAKAHSTASNCLCAR